LVVASDRVQVALAIEVHLNRLPEVVWHVVEHAPGDIGLGVVGAVKAQRHGVKAVSCF
jgi:hypothetical protein